jgi:hypothetical protein
MSILQDISKRLLAVATIPPEKRNDALNQVLIYIEEVQYDMVLEQKNLIVSVIESLIAENDAEQIAKSKLVFVQDVEEQIAPTKKTRAKKVVPPVAESVSDDLPDFIKKYPLASDIPEPVRKLIGLIRKEQNQSGNIDLRDTITGLFDFNKTSQGSGFWWKIYNGDLREFKQRYGNKGEKVDDLIKFAELNEFVEGLSEAPQTVEEDLPDFIAIYTPILQLPEQVKNLAIFRNKQENLSGIFSETVLQSAFDWGATPEGVDIWSNINDLGDLREFKRIYGNKGESVDNVINGLVGFNELLELANKKNAPAVKTRKPRTPKVAPFVPPVVAKQEVKYVEVILYPPKGGVLRLKVESPTELFTLIISILNKFYVDKLNFNFSTIARGGSYTTQVKLNSYDSRNEMLDKLVEQYDTFVKPELDWSDFSSRGYNPTTIQLNENILIEGFENKPAPVITQTSTQKVKTPKVPAPKPVKVVTPKVPAPKPVKVVTPKVVTPKTVKVVTPKPVKEVTPKSKTPKPVKVVTPKATKQKTTKPKVEDDLSFLDDLDNIF